MKVARPPPSLATDRRNSASESVGLPSPMTEIVTPAARSWGTNVARSPGSSASAASAKRTMWRTAGPAFSSCPAAAWMPVDVKMPPPIDSIFKIFLVIAPGSVTGPIGTTR